jgi:hypothetical protein
MGTLKDRLRNNQNDGTLDEGMGDYQEDLERRLQRPVDAGDRHAAAIGGN